MDINELEALQIRAEIALPVTTDWGDIESANRKLRIYDEGGHSDEQAAYIAALLTAAPDLIALIHKQEAEIAAARQAIDLSGLSIRSSALLAAAPTEITAQTGTEPAPQQHAQAALSDLYHALPDILPASARKRLAKTGKWAADNAYGVRAHTGKVEYRADDMEGVYAAMDQARAILAASQQPAAALANPAFDMRNNPQAWAQVGPDTFSSQTQQSTMTDCIEAAAPAEQAQGQATAIPWGNTDARYIAEQSATGQRAGSAKPSEAV